jgi:hypothetical protein
MISGNTKNDGKINVTYKTVHILQISNCRDFSVVVEDGTFHTCSPDEIEPMKRPSSFAFTRFT